MLEKEAPIERSGAATMTFLMPWLYSLSSAMNIRARDFPDAGECLHEEVRCPLLKNPGLHLAHSQLIECSPKNDPAHR